jgi:hypothetical protein
MATSSIRGGDRSPAQPSGTDVDRLGPSDSSDSGSDVQLQRPMPTRPDTPDELGSLPAHRGSTSDSQGTGERASAPGDAEDRDGDDIVPDQTEDIGADTGEAGGAEDEAELSAEREAELRAEREEAEREGER